MNNYYYIDVIAKGSILITNSKCNKPIKVNNEELVIQYFHSYEYSKFKNMIKNFYLKDLVNRKKYFNYLNHFGCHPIQNHNHMDHLNYF